MLLSRILLISIALMLFICRLAQPSIADAQPTEFGDVTIRLEVTGPISISSDAEMKLDAYLKHMTELKEWHNDAMAVVERLEKDGKLYPEEKGDSDPNKISQPFIRDSWKVGYNPLHNRVFSFPRSVIDEMRPRPEPVAIPESTQVDLRLHLTNDSDEPLDINEDIYCDVASIEFTVAGPRPWHRRNYNVHTTTDYKMGRRRTLNPGESFATEIKSFAHGKRGLTGNWVLCQPGDYEVTLKYHFRGLNPASAKAMLTVAVDVAEDAEESGIAEK